MTGLTKKININTAPISRSSMRVMIIYTGGTFGMIQGKENTLVPFDFNNTLEYLPVLHRLSLNLTVVAFSNPVDSSNINPAHWQHIAQIISENYDQQDGFLVLHGTDTMAYTSSAMSFMLQGIAKPVVFTGAQLPISMPRSDARENLVAALEIAAAYYHGVPIVPEVCLYFNSELHRGCRVKKVRSAYFDAFQSNNYPILAKVGTKIDYMRELILPISKKKMKILTHFDTRIAILKLFPGISEAYVQAVVGIADLQGLIIETYGSGNALNTTWFVSLLKQAIQKKNMLVLNISQCPAGYVVQSKYKTGKWLDDIGVISGVDMTIEAATTKLMLLIGEYGVEEAKKEIGRPLAGEIDTATSLS